MTEQTELIDKEVADVLHQGTTPYRSVYQRSRYNAQDTEEIDERRISQRQKQLTFGYTTQGYQNMMRLVEADPRLCNGGVLPLHPPAPTMKTSKRVWDSLIRKWRRTLHMFDHVFIDGEDDKSTFDDVVERQRCEWVSVKYASYAKVKRVRHASTDIQALQNARNVPTKIPVEECMIPILRNLDCYDPIQAVLPETSSPYHRSGTSPQNAGIKILIAPTGNGGKSVSQPSQSLSPSEPSTVARGGSPLQELGNMTPMERQNPAKATKPYSPPPYAPALETTARCH